MVDLQAQQEPLRAEIEAALRGVMDSGRYVLGPQLEAFESEAADFLGVRHTIGVGSGTDALLLALAAAGIGAGDEVITSPFTFIATVEAILHLGARPVFADIDPRTFNLDPEAVTAAVTPRTAAVIPVHLFGQPADLPRLLPICAEHGFILIEDCAQSFGAGIADRCTGSFGDAGAFSFYPGKNLGACGDGGLVTTNSDSLADRLRMLRNHGSRIRYRHELPGYSSRLDELQAAVLRIKLRHIREYNARRRKIAHDYTQLLADLPVTTPYEDGIGVHVYHQYSLQCDFRDRLAEHLQAAGIATAIHYPLPLHRQAACLSDTDLPHSDAASTRCLSLPLYPELQADDIQRVVGAIRGYFGPEAGRHTPGIGCRTIPASSTTTESPG